MLQELIEYLKDHLTIEIEGSNDYLGTPVVKVKLLLDNKTISESSTSIPENYYDSEW